MKKLPFVIITGMLSAVILTGCSGGGSGASTAPAASAPVSGQAASQAGGTTSTNLSGKQVDVIIKNLTNPFWISVKSGAEQAGKDLGVKVSVLAPLKAESNEEQSQMVEQAIASQIDAIAIAPSDSEGIIPAVQKANDANIPVVNFNTKIGGTKVLWKTFVGLENYDVGFQTVSKLCELMNGKGNMILIEGVSGAQTSIDRVSGAKDALKKYPNIKLVADQSADYNRAKAMNVVQNLLQSHSDVDAIYCCDDEMALGAVEAVASAGKTGKIKIAGCDANSDAQKAIKDGKMTLTADGHAYDQGYQAVKAAVECLQGKTLGSFIKVDMSLVDKSNAQG